MKKVMIASVLAGLAGYLVYQAYYNVGEAVVRMGGLLTDEGVGNSYVDREDGMRPRYVFQDGVGGSDFFDRGEGGVTGLRPVEDFEEYLG